MGLTAFLLEALLLYVVYLYREEAKMLNGIVQVMFTLVTVPFHFCSANKYSFFFFLKSWDS